METTLLIHSCHYHLPRSPINQSPLTNFSNTRIHVCSPMRHPTPTLRFVSSNIITTGINSHIIQDPRRLLSLNSCFRLKSMATKNDLVEASAIKEGSDKKKKEEEEEEELAKKLPPPPEKPEPGDCCGSGCVRCVWDVYYEELEAYNKLYKSDSNNSISKSS